MLAKGVHHVGLAVLDLEAAVATYTDLLGGRVEHRATVGDQDVEAASILVGGSRVELLAPTSAESPVGRFLDKRGQGMHHIAYEVDDVRAVLAHFSARGAQLIDEEPRRGLFGLQIAFVHPDAVYGVLTEVVSVG